MLTFEVKSIQMNKLFFLLLGFIYFSLNSSATTIDYRLGMENPNSHYFQIEMDISDLKKEYILIKMPVWSPGSYLVREFSKSVNLVHAYDQNGKELTINKTSKNAWKIDTKGVKKLSIKYDVYAFELSVRTSFLDDSHGFINGTSAFMYVDGMKNIPGKVSITPHPSFKKISTALKNEGNNVYSFVDYDELVDSPIEIGNHETFEFDAAGVKHTVAMYGAGNYDVPTLKRDMAKIVSVETMIFDNNPNKEYLFIIHNLTVPSGGLEHKKSTTLQVNRWTYQGDEYLRFLSLVAHEYFHIWTVKRLRPKALGPFDYDAENYTDLLWVMEGFTSYYDELALRRAGFYSEDQYLAKLFGTINYIENTGGNAIQPVAHASFDAWIKAYRPNENSVNTTISYYSKGGILAAMLDLYIINKFKAEKSLDNFLQDLYTEFYVKKDIGFTEKEFQSALEKFLGENMEWFFKDYIYGTKVIDYKKFFAGVGLTITPKKPTGIAELGVKTSVSGNNVTITNVYAGSAAEAQGLSANDEIIAVNGYRVNQANFNDFMRSMNVNDSFEILVSRDNILRTYTLKMGERNKTNYTFERDFNNLTEQQFNYWLRVDVE